jgi:hypothetical protein
MEKIQSVTKDHYAIKFSNMNKWLTEIEITATKRFFGVKEARQFVDETRPLIDGVYERLKRNVKSRYGKIVVDLWTQSAIDEYSIPLHHYDTMGGVCMINIPYDLDVYLDEKNQNIKNEIVFNILKEQLENTPPEVGLEKDLIINILTDVYQENKAKGDS